MSDPILHGKESVDGLVGVWPHGDSMRLRYSNGAEEDRRFMPFLHATKSAAHDISDAFHKSNVDGEQLDGPLTYDWRIDCRDLSTFYDLKSFLSDEVDSDEYYVEHSPKKQFLQNSGLTLYGDMSMEDVHRMQVDIETYSKDGFPDASRESDRIIIIAISDNQGYRKLLHLADVRHANVANRHVMSDVDVEHGLSCQNEQHLLTQFVRLIHKHDPDVIEGHNFLGFDAPYIRDRCKLRDVPFRIGRDNSEPRSWPSTKDFAEREVEYENFVVAGRSIVDSYFLAADYDTYARDLPSYGLKDLAKHFGVVSDDREYVKGENISNVWDKNPRRLLEYALDDVLETKGVVEQLGNASFALTKMVPMNWQQTIIAGTASTLESIMVREYMRQGHSLPSGSEPRSFKGGYTEAFWRGVFHDVAYADVSSLYPSIMLNWETRPSTDRLNVFLPMLQQLTDKRLKNKKKLKELDSDTKEYDRIDAKQAAQKVLINSSYGLAGHPYSLFSDIDVAEFVTKKGREILKKMIDDLLDVSPTVVLADTDGAMFVVPNDNSATEVVSYVDKNMPEGIEIDKDYEADTVVSYKAKNYAKKTDGEIELSGASLMGRQKEPFLRSYIKEQIENLANEDIPALRGVHDRYKKKLMQSEFTPDELCRRQRLKKTIDEYERGIEENPNKHRLAQYEIAKRKRSITGIEPKKGDTVYYYVKNSAASDVKVSRDARLKREYDGDEYKEYYLDRLNTTAELFEDFVDRPNVVFDKNARSQASLFGDEISRVSLVKEQVEPYPTG